MIRFINNLRRYRWYLLGRRKIRKQVKRNASTGKLKVVLGAYNTRYEGWISTDLPHFNILKSKDWKYFFHDQKIDNILIEHVLEHLHEKDVALALSLMHQYLKPGGIARIAVPDGYHPDQGYLKSNTPPANDHQSIWNINTLQHLLGAHGFHVEALEYYTDKGEFIGKNFDLNNGCIIRSKVKGYKNQNHSNYSSLIVDAYKLE